jgi:hypothetical protein
VHLPGLLTGFASSATGTKGTPMPIDPAMLAKSIATLTDLAPERDLAATLEQAVVAAKQLFAVDAAGIMLADDDGRLRWASASDPLAHVLEDNQEPSPLAPACRPLPAAGRRSFVTPPWSRAGARSLWRLWSCRSGRG